MAAPIPIQVLRRNRAPGSDLAARLSTGTGFWEQWVDELRYGREQIWESLASLARKRPVRKPRASLTPWVTPEPVTPEPGTPEPGTPEQETPEPVTPEPGTPEPGTPALPQLALPAWLRLVTRPSKIEPELQPTAEALAGHPRRPPAVERSESRATADPS